jgi:penicillin G amidase
MNSAEWRARMIFHAGNRVVALAVSACLLGLLGFGIGGVPALGRALVPGHGAWRSAAVASLPVTQTLTIAGLTDPGRVSFSKQGVASINARSDADAFLTLGYVQARFRLTEMDYERRVAEGRLAQLIGPSGVASDEFELRLGLLRIAEQEWAAMPKASPAARALVAYSRGVNDYLAQLRASGQWPAEFSLAGVYPRNWTPVDSLAVQGDLTQQLAFTTAPLDYALLERSLGLQRTMQWFPVAPPNQQQPYDPGPYPKLPLVPVAGIQAVALHTGSVAHFAQAAGITTAEATTAGATAARRATTARRATAAHGDVLSSAQLRAGSSGCGGGCARSRHENDHGQPAAISPGLAEAAASVLAEANVLPAGQLSSGPEGSAWAASSAWAANGPRVFGGGAMLAGDPQLSLTLPSVWYQVALTAPGLAVSGVSVPGLPAILIGHNAHIAWSVADAQSQTTLFYAEQTSPARPRQYFWAGQWRRMQEFRYTIPVRDGATVRLQVLQTVHGPVMSQAGRTVSVDWMGALGSPDEAVMLAVARAGDFGQFQTALAGWRSPALTFVYADGQGNIGAVSAGYYPQVLAGDPWLPMAGSGADDVAGVIPYAAVPQVYDPRSHVIAAADQRPVGPAYPYYIGTTEGLSDAGYRASAEYDYLGSHSSMQPSGFTALQASASDQLAHLIVPKLLSVLTQAGQHGPRLTPLQQQARQALASWNEQMSVNSGAASIWWTFWTDYLSDVFQPWWTAARVPVALDRAGLAVGPGQLSLDQDLQTWTLTDPFNAVFAAPARGLSAAAAARRVNWPGATPAAVVMRAAFISAVGQLAPQLGGGPGDWQWGKLHSLRFSSPTAVAELGSGPETAGGDLWTVDADSGGMNSAEGPSWRMVVQWPGASGGAAIAEGIYPGGQSDDPASPWYSDLLGDWQAGTYLPMPPAGGAAASSAAISWELQP